MKNQSKINKMLNKIICKAHSAKKTNNLSNTHDMLDSVYNLTEEIQKKIVEMEVNQMKSLGI